MIILRLLLLLTNLHLKSLSTQGTGADKLLSTQRVKSFLMCSIEYYKNHRSATIMVIKFELKNVNQIGTSVSFWPKKVKCWNFECDCGIKYPNTRMLQITPLFKISSWDIIIINYLKPHIVQSLT